VKPSAFAARNTKGVQTDINGSSICKERHVLFRNDGRNHPFVSVTTRHLVTDAELTLSCNKDFNFFDNARIDFVTTLHLVEATLAVSIKLTKTTFEARDDFKDLVTDRRRIDFDMIVDGCQLTEESLSDLTVRRDDNFTALRVDHVERDFFSKEDVRKLLSELVSELVFLLLVLVVDLLELLLHLLRINLL